jgi:hypothetical protein
MEMQQMERLLAGQARFDEKMDSNQAEMNAKIDANIMKMAAIRSELEETIKHQIQHFLSYVDESTQILPDAKKTVPDPRMMPSVEAHQDNPTEDVAVMPVRGLRKRRRVQNLAADSARRRRTGPGEFMDHREE